MKEFENNEVFGVTEDKKTKKVKLGIGGAVALVLITSVLTGIVSSALTAYAIYSKDVTENNNKVQAFTVKMSQINSVLDNMYYYDVDDNEMVENAAAAYVAGLDEPYTRYYSKDDFKAYNEELEDSYVGIGVVISAGENGLIEVVAPVEGSPAQESGILPGDYIIAVDGKEYSAEQMDDAVSVIKGGKEGTVVNITVYREGSRMDFSVVRGNISTESVSTKMLDNKIGYVRISAFNTNDPGTSQDTYTEFKEKVTALEKNGMEKMIIDIRDNPGGSLEVVCDIADMIVPEGIITYMQYKDGTREDFKSDANEMNIPIVVLINEHSASASEVLTGCLKDYQKATVIGKTSYGKGIVQSVVPFADGSGMSVTIASYFSPNGVCIHGTGIKPDIEVDIPEEYSYYYASSLPYEYDTQLKKAVEILSQ